MPRCECSWLVVVGRILLALGFPQRLFLRHGRFLEFVVVGR